MMNRQAAKSVEGIGILVSGHEGRTIYGVREWKENASTEFSGSNINYVVKCFQTWRLCGLIQDCVLMDELHRDHDTK